MEELTKCLRSYLKVHHKNIELPRLRLFPKGSCETSSLLLGKLLKSEFPDNEVWFVEGRNSNSNERHFWIEINNKTFDITLDQFDGIESPLYGVRSSFIESRFSEVEKILIDDALKTNDYAYNNVSMFECILNDVRGGVKSV
ncbi:hypothetical protein ACED51_24280 [Photobacterium swingsii]|uniref:hypothetical protein n=1 Tax=Photobacterium swingsii TaxID=680026 RepID=UPI00352F5DD3